MKKSEYWRSLEEAFARARDENLERIWGYISSVISKNAKDLTQPPLHICLGQQECLVHDPKMREMLLEKCAEEEWQSEIHHEKQDDGYNVTTYTWYITLS